MRDGVRGAVAGAASGAIATVWMSGFMLAAQRLGWLGQMPPKKIADAGLDAAGAEEAPEPARRATAALLHLGFGAGMGALFGAFHQRTRLPHPLAQATVYGLGIWLASYCGWVPALGIMPPPQRDRPGRPTAMVLAHVVYGVALGRSVARRA